MLIATVVTTAMVASAGAAIARGYSGSYPVTVTHSQHGDGTYCLTLTETSRDAGSASVVIGSQKFPYGTFQVINHLLVATIQVQGYSQNAGMVFIGTASRGNIGDGVFDDVYGGEAFEEGALAFGMRGGC
jgi:hypothetical protein